MRLVLVLAAGVLPLSGCSHRKVPELVHAAPKATRSCKVVARAFCNDTGIDLKEGKSYRIAVSSTWTDWFVRCDETGPLCPVIDFFLIPGRLGLRFSPARDRRAKFFSLVGFVGEPEGRKVPRDAFLLRDGMRFTAQTTGRLHAFANDWRIAYGNNKGCLMLTVIEE